MKPLFCYLKHKLIQLEPHCHYPPGGKKATKWFRICSRCQNCIEVAS